MLKKKSHDKTELHVLYCAKLYHDPTYPPMMKKGITRHDITLHTHTYTHIYRHTTRT